jgi:Asp-tRNA(Asn)/Glu-tRNA(Gln) amidotransferase A subunit family amidase
MSAVLADSRRQFLAQCSALGVAGTLLPGLLWAKAAEGVEITAASVAAAEEIAGVRFTDAEREQLVNGLRRQATTLAALHEVSLPNSVAPAISFSALPRPSALPRGESRPPVLTRRAASAAPSNDVDLAFTSLGTLADLLRRRVLSSERLTTMYLNRLEGLNPQLLCATTLLRERALARARAADAEIAAGRYKGPLHGIPWGAKDLLAVAGAPTTWGAAPFRDQHFETDATVVKRLDDAGAVLIAKLTLGELAMGDVWFGGMTRNPWNVEQGSSGSSAGSASATAAGCVSFAVGSETLGSISSPSTRCGVTGLRPTFGRVPRSGAMALSWTMDKLGPIARSAEDCAIVFSALHGPDDFDATVHAAPFRWDGNAGVRGLRVGVMRADFERQQATKPFDTAALGVLAELGVKFVDVAVPEQPYNAMRIILNAEAGAAFEDLMRSGRTAELAGQGPNAWPATFREAHFIPATDYINANRVRTQAILAWEQLMQQVDVIVAPTGSGQLLATNLTGHPAVILPHGFRENGTPLSITFIGRLFDEATLLRVAHAYQLATDFHLKRPPMATVG